LVAVPGGFRADHQCETLTTAEPVNRDSNSGWGATTIRIDSIEYPAAKIALPPLD